MKFKSIEVKNLTKKYKGNIGLKNINFTLSAGSICAIIGKNGAGKSTLLKLITNQIRPSKGEVSFVNLKNDITPTIGSLIENPTFFENLTAAENLNYFFLQKKGKFDQKSIEKVLNMVDLPNSHKKFSSFSLGMRQRLGIALSLIFNPDILVLDEPVNGLDPEGVRDIREVLKKVNEKYGTTILISSHILSELEEISTNYVFLDKGELIKKFSKSELLEKQKGYLILKVNNTKKAVEVLENYCSELNIFIDNENTLKITEYGNKQSEINKTLVGNNIKVQEISIQNKSLEEYFFEEVGRKKDD